MTDVPADTPTASRKVTAIVAVAAVVGTLLLAASILGVVWWRNPDRQYINQLEAAGQLGQFSADRAAIQSAHDACDRLDHGAKPQGTEADRIGVERYCPDYLAAFKVLAKQTVVGTFSITDLDGWERTSGINCQGDGGFGDLNASTQVIVKSASGSELARSPLGVGNIVAGSCRFTFPLYLTEGEDTYVVAVGRRGEFSYTWERISQPEAIALTIG